MKRRSNKSFYVLKHSIPYTLVIIDVQQGYSAAKDPVLLHNLELEIKKARECNAAILIVNMHPHEGVGKSIAKIWNAAYEHIYFAAVTKMDTTGAYEIIKASEKYRFINKNNFKIGGVYTDVCVADTINELADKLPDSTIEVLGHCCNSDFPAYPESIDMYEDDGETYNPLFAIEEKDNVIFV